MDSVDKLTKGPCQPHRRHQYVDTTQRQLLARLDPTSPPCKPSKTLPKRDQRVLGLVTQMEDMTRSATVMGRTRRRQQRRLVHLPPEAFQNPDFQRGQTLPIPDGTCARFVTSPIRVIPQREASHTSTPSLGRRRSREEKEPRYRLQHLSGGHLVYRKPGTCDVIGDASWRRC